MSALGLALVGAVFYGAADFLGGFASRKNAPAVVVVISQLFGLLVLVVAFGAVRERFAPGDIPLGMAAGVAGALGIGALYAALAVGRMGVVSPITAAVGASVPVVVGLVSGERPATLALAGVALAFVAVVLVSLNSEVRGISLREPGLLAALLSGAAIGVLYVLLSRGRPDAGLSLLTVTRCTSIPLLVLYALARRESLRPAAGTLRTIGIAGALDMAANVAYVFATHSGLLAVVAVVTSLYPAATVLLARIVLKEHLSGTQWLGAACALAGVVLIAL